MRITRRALPAVLALAAAALAPSWDLRAAPAGFVVERHLGSLGTVTAIAFAPDGTLFLTEKGGAVRVLPFGAPAPRLFASIPVYTQSECGLLGLALDPGYTRYASGGLVYLFATVSSSEQRIIRFQDGNGTGTDRRDIRTGLPTLGANHDGGCLRIGPDGKFYLAVGDGGSGASKSQDLSNLFGKVMRLNLDGTAPADNPFVGTAGARADIYAYGFRNPFRIVLRPLGPGPVDFQVFVNDVGSSGGSRREEVNRVVVGGNHGWPVREGFTAEPAYVSPLQAYSAEGSSITGGVFYQGSAFPAEYRGNYFYMDYVSNRIFRMVLDGDAVASNATFHTASGGLIDMAEGPDGAIYYSTGNGQVFRIRYEVPGNLRPTARLSADRLAGEPPLDVSFDASASTDDDGSVVRWDWSFGDGTSHLAGGPQVAHRYAIDGRFTARVTVTDEKGGSATASVDVEVATVDLPPVAEILAPADGSTFDADALVELTGQATDPEDGALDGARLTWEVILHHDDHTHPFADGLQGAAASFRVPRAGIEENWSFRIRLTAADSAGHRTTVERTVGLNYFPLALSSEPAGLRLTADGVSLFTPAVHQAVRGAQVELGAPSPQAEAIPPGSEARWSFSRWSDGGPATRTVEMAEGLSLHAVFEADPRALFVRGDSNRDGSMDVSDAVFTLAALFTGGRLWPCPDAGDANDDGGINIADPIRVLTQLFSGDALPIPPPVERPGFDPTPDGLPCEGIASA